MQHNWQKTLKQQQNSLPVKVTQFETYLKVLTNLFDYVYLYGSIVTALLSLWHASYTSGEVEKFYAKIRL